MSDAEPRRKAKCKVLEQTTRIIVGRMVKPRLPSWLVLRRI